MRQKITSTLSKYEKIILVGWGTGGHIQPIVSLVHSLDIGTDRYIWIGWVGSTEEQAAKKENIEFQSIPTLKLATTRSWRSLLYPFYLIAGFWRARELLQALESKQENIAVFSKWWPGSVVIGLAAWSLYIPLYIHESDTIPGRSNRILWKFADTIFLGFESASIYFNEQKCEVVGQILDPVFSRHCEDAPSLSVGSTLGVRNNPGNNKNNLFTAGSPRFARDDRNKIHWKTTKPHILVICGSQWSRVIFQEIAKNYSQKNAYEWIIALGKLNSGMQSEFEKIPDCQALDWISQWDIAHLIGDTDLAITRGSATTLAELTSSQNSEFANDNLQLIIIPLPYSAGNHQYYNALEYQKMGHTILEQKNLDQLNETIQQYV